MCCAVSPMIVHLVLFCKKSLLAWSLRLLSRMDVLRLNVIPHFGDIRKHQNIPACLLLLLINRQII